MNLEQVFDEWEVDCKIDESDLGNSSTRTPELHHKYLKELSYSRLRLVKKEAELKELIRIKTEYYNGTLDEDTLIEKKWKPFQIKLLNVQIPAYVQADSEVTEMQLQVHFMKEKVDVLESIVKFVNNRNFVIKNNLDWLRWTQGSS